MGVVTTTMNVGGSRVLVAAPTAIEPGPLSIELSETFAYARRDHLGACVLASAAAEQPLLSLAPDGVELVRPRGLARAAMRARLGWVAAVRQRRVASAERTSARLFEWHKELRRHAGNERLPLPLRTSLREAAQRAAARSVASSPLVQFPRRLLREPVPVSLPGEVESAAARAALEAGIPPGRPIVAIDWRRRPDNLIPAIAWLQREGFLVVRIGMATERLALAGLVDIADASRHLSLAELHVLLRARFLVCESVDLQHVAYLTCTPSLLLNASDPFRAYPVRGGHLFTLATAVDLDTGARFQPGEMLDERYVRAMRNCGFRENDAADVLAAVTEMRLSTDDRRPESGAQARFRERATAGGALVARQVPSMAGWGPDEGFLGDGRLAQWQAEHVN